jgi:uncharacterized protein (TIGR02145 family)
MKIKEILTLLLFFGIYFDCYSVLNDSFIRIGNSDSNIISISAINNYRGPDYSGLQYKNFNREKSAIFDDFNFSVGEKPINIITYATDELSNSGSPGMYKDFRNYWVVEFNSKNYLIEVEPGRQTSTQEDRDKREKNQKEGNGEITYVWEIQGQLVLQKSATQQQVNITSTNLIDIKNQIKIGNQTWSIKNLDVSTFCNGEIIPQAKTDEEWKRASNDKKPAWCYYNNDLKNGAKYGKLYNWYAVSDSRGLAPTGWHIPTDEEFNELISFLGGNNQAAQKLKSNNGWANYTYTTGGDNIYCKNCKDWNDEYKKKVPCHVCKDNRIIGKTPEIKHTKQNGNNKSGFAALPGGCRSFSTETENLNFNDINKGCYFWTYSQDSQRRELTKSIYIENGYYNNYSWEDGQPTNKVEQKSENKGNGFSVRCIKGPGTVLDDGIPKSPTGNDINLQLMDTRTRLFVQSADFVGAIQKSINKGINDYLSNNIFK